MLDINNPWTVLQDGLQFTISYGTATVHHHHLGDLVLTSGAIVACDPYFARDDTEPFTVRVAPGTYPAIVGVAHFDNGDQRVAYTMLRFNGRVPVRWQLALTAGQDVQVLEEDEFFGYGVDAGTGCFMDVDAARELDRRMQADEQYSDAIQQEAERNYVHTWDWTNFVLDPTSGLNLICFSSGWGDGAYPSYFGYDSRDAVAYLVTDFGVIQDESE